MNISTYTNKSDFYFNKKDPIGIAKQILENKDLNLYLNSNLNSNSYSNSYSKYSQNLLSKLFNELDFFYSPNIHVITEQTINDKIYQKMYLSSSSQCDDLDIIIDIIKNDPRYKSSQYVYYFFDYNIIEIAEPINFKTKVMYEIKGAFIEDDGCIEELRQYKVDMRRRKIKNIIEDSE